MSDNQMIILIMISIFFIIAGLVLYIGYLRIVLKWAKKDLDAALNGRAKACLQFCDGIDTEDMIGRDLAEYVADQAFIKGMQIEDNGISMQMSGLGPRLLAASFAGQFKGRGAINYLTMDMGHPSIGNFTVTMQRAEGKTVVQKITELTEQRDGLLKATEHFANTWLIDERDDHDREVCLSDQHYRDVQDLFIAIEKAKGGAL